MPCHCHWSLFHLLPFAQIVNCIHHPGIGNMFLLLLLMRDVSLDPGPSEHNFRLGTINAHTIRDKAPALFDLMTSNGCRPCGCH